MAHQLRNPPCEPLHVSGNAIVNTVGAPVVLKGTALGGYLNMENFITGYPGHEYEHRAALAATIGQDKADFFFARFLHYFFTEADAAYLSSLGMNCIRLPFNYRHFIDDQNPTSFKEEGFTFLDRVIKICSAFNLYVILDLHAAPGGQNQDWHSDSGISKALFWEFRIFQDQTIELWKVIAARYKDSPVVAGYNLLNEPADSQHTRLIAWYERAEREIRAVDPETILFIDGNTYSMDFSRFEHVLPNSVYACHDYATYGFPIAGQPLYSGNEEQRTKLQRQFDRKAAFMREKGVPIWNGEFGPVYANSSGNPEADIVNNSRFEMLKKQLDIYAKDQTSWSIWLYKDIGYQGMVYLNPESSYMRLIAPFVAKKQRLSLDYWGCVDKEGVRALYEPFIAGLKEMVPNHLHKIKYPHVWTFERHVERVVRESLLSEYLGWEFAELFRGKTEEQLDELARSFAFENCIKREGLNAILRTDSARTPHQTDEKRV
ncbi:Beta-xylosidase [Fusarium oxysporum f. sp. cubense]|uniref:Beta-xylosidase n=1 Tax=Fusarium oxysporum f. sp. cubense TaxID=61366 RepID=A0A559KXG5_FUSOC|nr:Beta-xylosidase [Fusarium oxysporum f. sp. cubense]